MTAAEEERQVDPLVGRIVDGRFELQQFLGSGAVGSVYRAKDSQTGQAVAVKIWNGTGLDQQTLGRFRREALALTTLCHPNIVGVSAWGMVDNLPYVAMEYLEGETLEKMLTNRQPLDTELVLDVSRQMLSALAYAHGLGVVHRDLKPDNVLVVPTAARAERTSLRSMESTRTIKLLDFGLAKFLSPEADPVKGALTMLGMVMGTPLYMAPEQAAGRTIDARVDVYAAGCVVFEMLTGQPPYLGESNGEILRQHMIGPIPKLSDLRRDVVVLPALQEFLEKALAKSPDDRFADAGQMLAALNELPRPVLRRPSTMPAPLMAAAPTNDALKLSLGTPPQPPRAPQQPAPRLQPVAAAPEKAAGRSERLQLIAALVTGVVTALALAYALLH
jgi:serine/threonine-protein kinase